MFNELFACTHQCNLEKFGAIVASASEGIFIRVGGRKNMGGGVDGRLVNLRIEINLQKRFNFWFYNIEATDIANLYLWGSNTDNPTH